VTAVLTSSAAALFVSNGGQHLVLSGKRCEAFGDVPQHTWCDASDLSPAAIIHRQLSAFFSGPHSRRSQAENNHSEGDYGESGRVKREH
jgi:hypothetical protein